MPYLQLLLLMFIVFYHVFPNVFIPTVQLSIQFFLLRLFLIYSNIHMYIPYTLLLFLQFFLDAKCILLPQYYDYKAKSNLLNTKYGCVYVLIDCFI